jgi:hypothetical protein
MTAFNAMPSVRTSMSLKTLNLAPEAWLFCCPLPELLETIKLARRTDDWYSALRMAKSLTYFFDAIILVLSPPGQKITWKPGPSGTLNVESWSS